MAARTKARAAYAILGPDSFLAEQALERLLTAAVGEDRADSVQVFHGEETTWARVLDAARTRSLFAERRAVVVREAESLKGEGEEVASYLDDPTPGLTLILLAAKPDRRRTAWKRVLERAEVLPAQPLKGRGLRAYVSEQLQRRKVPLAEDGLTELIERVGQDLRRLMGEVDKLEAFAAGRPVSAEEVSAVLGRGLARPLYRLGDALVAREAGKALELMEEILDEGDAPVLVLGTLHRALRQVRGAQALRPSRMPWSEAASRLKVPPFKVGELMEASGRWSEADLRAAFAALGRADRRLKSGADPRVGLAAAVAEAIAGRSGPFVLGPGERAPSPRPGPPPAR